MITPLITNLTVQSVKVYNPISSTGLTNNLTVQSIRLYSPISDTGISSNLNIAPCVPVKEQIQQFLIIQS